MTNQSTIHEAVKSRYAQLAKGGSCCGPDSCGTPHTVTDISTAYSAAELSRLPEGANLGLGCGNPVALAEIRSGDMVVDLGSGAGVDCFLAAQRVEQGGRVIGVDMTPAMIAKARENATRGGFTNVEFRLGEIENLPVEPDSADLVLSNCVINLAPDKERVFQEIFRVLRPGGRFCISDVVSKGQIPQLLRQDMEQWAGCVAGALDKDEYLDIVRSVGFVDLEIKAEVDYDYGRTTTFSLASLTLAGVKPI